MTDYQKGFDEGWRAGIKAVCPNVTGILERDCGKASLRVESAFSYDLSQEMNGFCLDYIHADTSDQQIAAMNKMREFLQRYRFYARA